MLDQEGLQRANSTELEPVPKQYPEKYLAIQTAPQSSHKYGGEYNEPQAVRVNRICGSRRSTFVLALLLVVAVIAAAVTGGILGYQKSAASKASTTPTTSSGETTAASSAATSTSTAKSSFVTLDRASFTPPTNVNLTLDCPAIDSTYKIYDPSGTSYRADFYCGQNCRLQNMFAMFIYTLDDCVDACLSMKSWNSSSCTGITFRADLENVTTTYQGYLTGNCFVNTDCVLADYDANIVTAIITLAS